MDEIDINNIKENDVIKFITPNKTLFDGVIKKISSNFLGVTINTKQDEFIMFNKNQIVELIIADEIKATKCCSVILGCNQSDFEQVVIISIPKPVLGIDRRKFERLPVVIDMEYAILSPDIQYKNLNNVESKYFRNLRKTFTVNISAGGIYFIISKNEAESNFALISLTLKNEKITALCEKIRTDYISDSKHDRVAFKYKDIKPTHRQLILDFIIEKSKEISNKDFG